MNYEALLQKLPGVESPKKRLSFNERLKWTGMILISYFLLSDTFLLGVKEERLQYFEQLATLIGASMGTIITLGIGPIVTASIILQLLVGAKIIDWDLSSHHGRIMFQGTQKILAFTFALVEAAAYTLFGAIEPAGGTIGIVLFVILQLAIGGWLVIFMDEVVSKWGFGSGVSLFIAAGISKEIIIRTFSVLKTNTGSYAGLVPQTITLITSGNPTTGNLLPLVIPLVSTILVFILVVYAQSMRVEIPLAFGSVRGFGRKWPLKFIYTNVMPVILTSAIMINLQVWGNMLYKRGVTFLGTFDDSGNPMSGIIYYFTPPSSSMSIQILTMTIFFFAIIGIILAYRVFKEKEYVIVGISTFIGILVGTYIASATYGLPAAKELARVAIYMTSYVVGCAVFSMFWVGTSGMDAKNVARQIQSSGMQIPGFRRDPRVIERVLERYIPALSILGGAFVGFLASFADMSGAIVRGTGLLLTVMIIFQLYEQLATQQLEDLHPALRQFLQK